MNVLPDTVLLAVLGLSVVCGGVLAANPATSPAPNKNATPPPLVLLEITRGDVNAKRIALTFDAGDLDNAITQILDTLKSERVRCTIFVTGSFIQKHPKEVLRMLKDGHEIGNHTCSHPRLTTYETNRRHFTLPSATREFVQNELRSVEKTYEALTHQKLARYWRAPYGERNAEILSWACELGYEHVAWTTEGKQSLDSRDWLANKSSPLYRTAEEVVQYILAFGEDQPHGKNGAIVLMHMGTPRRTDCVHDKLRHLIHGLQGQGYSVGTVTDTVSEGVRQSLPR